jgi:hypothetical protein
MLTYEIGSKVYEQKALVWGQVQQLTNLLKGLSFSQDMSPVEMISIIGDKMPIALAIVLTEQGKSSKGKNLTEVAEELAFDTSVELVVRIIEDFFDCNPTALYLEKINKMVGSVTNQVNQSQGIISTGSPSS